jgi:DNA-binding NarL/FixJ family response regulator
MNHRLLIVAEDAFTAESLRRCARGATNCTVIGYMSARRPCGLAIQQITPDVALVDDPATSDHALERIREIHGVAEHVRVILLTDRMDADRIAEATDAGVHAVIARSTSASSLGVLLREIAAGNVFHTFKAARATPRPADTCGLTARELEILSLAASGAPNGRIASDLWVTEQTVKFHLSNVYRKLGVANRTQASSYAHMHGLVHAGPNVAGDERAA